MSADEIALLKEGSDRAAYEAVLKHALWGDWLLRVQTRTQCVPLMLVKLPLHLTFHTLPPCPVPWSQEPLLPNAAFRRSEDRASSGSDGAGSTRESCGSAAVLPRSGPSVLWKRAGA